MTSMNSSSQAVAAHCFFIEPDAPVISRDAPEALDQILVHCSINGFSDINLQTEEPIIGHKDSKLIPISRRSLSSRELEEAVSILYGGQSGLGRIRGGDDVDPSYSVRHGGERLRYRVNATGCDSYGNPDGIQITIRTINSKPPRISDLGIEQEIVDNYRVDDGLVLVCGGTGNGKSTTLAALITEIIADEDANRKIIEYASPIEYVYDSIARHSVVITQHEIGRHLPSWERAVRNSLRRAPHIIVVGECRDHKTMAAALEASETGHTVYTTLHADSVPGTFYRAVNMFPSEERSTRMYEIAEAMRMIVVQKLVRRIDKPGRVALREFLVFDENIRAAIRNTTSLKDAVSTVASFLDRRGQTMLADATAKAQAGLISPSVVSALQAKGRAELLDSLGTAF